jgi:hypothetical protein
MEDGMKKEIWSSCGAFAVGLVMVAGCTRSGLQARAADGSVSISAPDAQDAVVPDLGTDPPSEAWEAGERWPDGKADLPGEPGPEAGSERPPEVGGEPGSEAGAETGREDRPETGSEIGAEAGTEVGSEVGSETGTEAGSSACANLSKTPRSLGKLEGQALSSALAVLGDGIFVGTQVDGASPAPPSGRIVAVSFAAGTQTVYPLGENIANQIVARQGALFYSPGRVVMNGDGWQYFYTDVARLDLVTGQVSVVDSSLPTATFGIWSVVSNARGEVYWSMITDLVGPSVIRRWNEATRGPETIFTWDQALSLLADSDRFYWSELMSSGQTAFMSVSVAGGTVTQVFQSPEQPSLAAVDDQSLYYSFWNDPAKGIVAVPKQGGEGRTLVANAAPILLASKTIDETHVYWVDMSDQDSIRRASKTGTGGIEIVWRARGRGIADMAVDACNVYWTAGNPSELFVRAK